MIILLDNFINNYLNILSSIIILSLFTLNKYKLLNLLCIDILINKIPVITFFVVLFYYINKLVFKKIINNNINIFIFSCIYMIIFLSFLYLINDYNYNYLYYLKSNLISIIFNIIIYYMYIFYK